ncbi:MAG TPA: non-heme iron oxygenase ferredoxin subunit [Acidimicrobiales bacterium]|jgi:3-phenylpropionate/trans-cinnamate dioxygenase ferredoxin component
MPEHAIQQRLCRLDELASGEARRFEVAGHPIAVVRIGDDVYAIGDRCTHQDISLAEGEVHADERTIECWKHGSEFSLETGEPLSLPATRAEPVYHVRVEDGDIVVVLDE